MKPVPLSNWAAFQAGVWTRVASESVLRALPQPCAWSLLLFQSDLVCFPVSTTLLPPWAVQGHRFCLQRKHKKTGQRCRLYSRFSHHRLWWSFFSVCLSCALYFCVCLAGRDNREEIDVNMLVWNWQRSPRRFKRLTCITCCYFVERTICSAQKYRDMKSACRIMRNPVSAHQSAFSF